MSKKTVKEVTTKATANKSTKRRSKSATAKCEKCNKPFSYNPAGEKPALCKACEEEKNKVVYRGTCKDCGKEFYVKAGEAEFLKSKGLALPKRCFECRSYRKIEKAKENG